MTTTVAASTARSYDVLGQTVTIPVRVRSARMAAATYLVNGDAAQSIIDSTGLTVARKRKGAIVALALVRYVDSDLGEYNELGLTFVVDDPAAPRLRPEVRWRRTSTGCP